MALPVEFYHSCSCGYRLFFYPFSKKNTSDAIVFEGCVKLVENIKQPELVSTRNGVCSVVHVP